MTEDTPSKPFDINDDIMFTTSDSKVPLSHELGYIEDYDNTLHVAVTVPICVPSGSTMYMYYGKKNCNV